MTLSSGGWCTVQGQEEMVGEISSDVVVLQVSFLLITAAQKRDTLKKTELGIGTTAHIYLLPLQWYNFVSSFIGVKNFPLGSSGWKVLIGQLGWPNSFWCSWDLTHFGTKVGRECTHMKLIVHSKEDGEHAGNSALMVFQNIYIQGMPKMITVIVSCALNQTVKQSNDWCHN